MAGAGVRECASRRADAGRGVLLGWGRGGRGAAGRARGDWGGDRPADSAAAVHTEVRRREDRRGQSIKTK